MVCQVYNIDYSAKQKIKQTIHQLIDHFPLVCIEKGHYVLVDYCEMAFHSGIVSEMMSLDKPHEPDSESAAQSFLVERNCEGIMFYQQPGPVLLQTKFPQL